MRYPIPWIFFLSEFGLLGCLLSEFGQWPLRGVKIRILGDGMGKWRHRAARKLLMLAEALVVSFGARVVKL
jgi:hypothetical protein